MGHSWVSRGNMPSWRGHLVLMRMRVDDNTSPFVFKRVILLCDTSAESKNLMPAFIKIDVITSSHVSPSSLEVRFDVYGVCSLTWCVLLDGVYEVYVWSPDGGRVVSLDDDSGVCRFVTTQPLSHSCEAMVVPECTNVQVRTHTLQIKKTIKYMHAIKWDWTRVRSGFVALSDKIYHCPLLSYGTES